MKARVQAGGAAGRQMARSQPPHPQLECMEGGGKGLGGDGQKLLWGSRTLQMGLGSELRAL